jgi:hypothetical protein
MKLAIAIASCEKHKDREIAILKTWGEKCPIPIVFHYGEPSDYGHLPEKMKKVFTEMKDHDFIFKTDSDTFLSIPRLLASGFEKYDYSGFTREEWNPTYCYGPGYWVSQKSMKILATSDWNLHRHPIYPDAEDVMVGMVLFYSGILPHHDARYGHFTPVLWNNTKILQHLSSRRKFEVEDMYLAHQRFTNGG